MSRGHDRERLIRALLEAGVGPVGEVAPWWVSRAAGSLGDADLVALRVDIEDGAASPTGFVYATKALLVEVKSTADGPYKTFGPADRSALREAAELAGADAWLCWCPPCPGQRGIHGCWIPEWEWPD